MIFIIILPLALTLELKPPGNQLLWSRLKSNSYQDENDRQVKVDVENQERALCSSS